MNRTAPLLASLFLAAAAGAGLWWQGMLSDKTSALENIAANARVTPVQAQPVHPPITDANRLKEGTEALRLWLTARPGTDVPERLSQWEAEGLRLASERREQLSILMRTDAEAALRQAITWDEWERLPEGVRAVSERPVSEWVRQDSFIGCDPEKGYSQHELRITREDGSSLRAYSHGRRRMPLTRAGVPVQGFVLGEEAALEADAVKIVTGDETAAARRALPVLASAAGVSLWSGQPVTGAETEAVTVLVGGYVAQVLPDEVPLLRERLHAWENIPGETAGVERLAAWLESGDSGDFIPFMEEEFAPPEDDPWTGTPKKLLLMRVDFSDLTGARETHAALVDKLDNSISPLIEEMSYGKTRLITTVTTEVIRMPEPSTYYAEEQAAGNNPSQQIMNSAEAAARDLGYDVDDYALWCVQFKGIGLPYGGLGGIGGKRSWIQSSGFNVFVHEFGHNYGLGHASRWLPDPEDGPLGEGGTSVEYGSGSSMMGGGPYPTGHFDAQSKAFLNWLDATQWQNVTTSGRYRLWRADDPRSPLPGHLGGLRIPRPDAAGDFLWLSYKRNIPGRRRLARGVSVLWEKLDSPRRTWIIRAGRPGSFPEDDYELPVGQTFSDGSGVHITPVERGGTAPWQWVDVEVRLGAASGNQAPLAFWSRVPSGEVQPFQTLRLDVQALDPDGDALAYHWDVGDGSEVSYNGPSLIHTYETGGLYEVSVQISDMRGGSTTLTHVIDAGSASSAWTKRSSGTTAQLNAITASTTRAVAVSATGHIVHSINGTDWTAYDLKAALGTHTLDFREVLSDGSQFVAVGRERLESGGSFEGCIFHSPDGLTWTRVYWGGSILQRVAYGDGTWVVSGENSTMLTSTDGLSWSAVSFPETDHIQALAYGNGRWLAMADSSGRRTWAHTSTDLQTWTELTWAETLSNNQIVRPVRWMDGEFYLGGFAVGLRSVSADAQTLDETQLLSGMSVSDMVMVGGIRYVAGNITEDDTDRGHVHLSVTGQEWQRIPLANAQLIRGITLLNNRLITVGNAGEIWQSGFLSAPAASGWHLWKTENKSLLGAEDDPLEIPPGSSYSNLFHYAVGNAPGSSANARLPFASADPNGRLKLALPRSSIRPDIQYRVLRSTNLQTWSSTGIETLVDSPDLLEVRSSSPAFQGREFLRFEVELDP
ncbi:PKD domain-containing protein [Prosthecobacter sp. SYSU 5D2]|uniref:PKD domain-containing protein n=1 Tax=Prosthecobacter sp. SYSU 5D2 TaxID=3134134 RepID=UPI0031FE5874